MRKAIYVLLLLCWHFRVGAQSVTPTQFKADLDHLESELPKRHTNLFANLTSDRYSALINGLRSKVDSLDEPHFEMELYRLMRAIGDEHTRVEPEYHTRVALSFDFFAEGIYVTGTDPGHRHLLYHRLDGIHGIPVKTVLERFKGVVKEDNPSYYRVFVMRFLTNPRFLRGLGLAESDTVVSYQLDGKAVDIVAGLIPPREVRDAYTFELLPGGILKFDYRSCIEMEGRPFATFNDSLFALIKRVHPIKLVIDLRNNSGGNSGILDPFLDSLKASYLNHSNTLFVLTGKATFSSALMNAIDLKRNYQSVLIGEPTSGNINHYGETRGFRLPNTRIVIGYSTRYWENWKGHDGPLVPDQLIEYHIEDLKAGKDAAMEAVRKMAPARS